MDIRFEPSDPQYNDKVTERFKRRQVLNLLSPAKGEIFRAIGTVKKPGKNTTVTQGELLSYEAGEEKLVAMMVGTIMTIYDCDGIES